MTYLKPGSTIYSNNPQGEFRETLINALTERRALDLAAHELPEVDPRTFTITLHHPRGFRMEKIVTDI